MTCGWSWPFGRHQAIVGRGDVRHLLDKPHHRQALCGRTKKQNLGRREGPALKCGTCSDVAHARSAKRHV